MPTYPKGISDPKRALFVTWNIEASKDDQQEKLNEEEEELRGCIGTFEPKLLSKILGEHAIISALEDDRFDPVTLEEVAKLSVTLSLLENFEEISDPLNWEVGKHGVEIEFEFDDEEFSSTFLPEIAKEEGWDQEETLRELVEKSGCPGDFEEVRPLIKAKRYISKIH